MKLRTERLKNPHCMAKDELQRVALLIELKQLADSKPNLSLIDYERVRETVRNAPAKKYRRLKSLFKPPLPDPTVYTKAVAEVLRFKDVLPAPNVINELLERAEYDTHILTLCDNDKQLESVIGFLLGATGDDIIYRDVLLRLTRHALYQCGYNASDVDIRFFADEYLSDDNAWEPVRYIYNHLIEEPDSADRS